MKLFGSEMAIRACLTDLLWSWHSRIRSTH
jgi:hypothetical protein